MISLNDIGIICVKSRRLTFMSTSILYDILIICRTYHTIKSSSCNTIPFLHVDNLWHQFKKKKIILVGVKVRIFGVEIFWICAKVAECSKLSTRNCNESRDKYHSIIPPAHQPWSATRSNPVKKDKRNKYQFPCF